MLPCVCHTCAMCTSCAMSICLPHALPLSPFLVPLLQGSRRPTSATTTRPPAPDPPLCAGSPPLIPCCALRRRGSLPDAARPRERPRSAVPGRAPSKDSGRGPQKVLHTSKCSPCMHPPPPLSLISPGRAGDAPVPLCRRPALAVPALWPADWTHHCDGQGTLQLWAQGPNLCPRGPASRRSARVTGELA